jgi:hypothetical protein
MADTDDCLKRVDGLLAHADFSLKNPNKMRSLVVAFAGNLRRFHAADGSGYQWLADRILEVTYRRQCTAGGKEFRRGEDLSRALCASVHFPTPFCFSRETPDSRPSFTVADMLMFWRVPAGGQVQPTERGASGFCALVVPALRRGAAGADARAAAAAAGRAGAVQGHLGDREPQPQGMIAG